MGLHTSAPALARCHHHGPSDSNAHGHQHRLKSRLWASAQPMVVTGAIHMNSRPWLALCLGSRHGPRQQSKPTWYHGPCISTGLLDRGGMALSHQHVHSLWPRPWASVWFLVTLQANNINTDPDYGRTIDLDMVLINSPCFLMLGLNKFGKTWWDPISQKFKSREYWKEEKLWFVLFCHSFHK